MRLNLVNASEPVLNRRVGTFSKFGSDLNPLISEMFRVMEENNGVGLAANQVGLDINLFIWAYDGDRGYILNPSLILSGEMIVSSEGCLSLPGLFGLVPRYESVELKGMDMFGSELILKASGFKARIFQHEVDHLNGKLYTERTLKLYNKSGIEEVS